MDSLEKEAYGAIFGASFFALFFDDDAKQIGVFSSERVRQVTTAGDVDTEENGYEESAELAREIGLAKCWDGLGESIGQ